MGVLRRLFDRLTSNRAPASGQVLEEKESSEFDDMLMELGAEPAEPDPIGQRDTTITELRGMLVGLRDIGDQFAVAENARIQGVERLDQREGVLERERERHAATREKLQERKEAAADRWRELQSLRATERRLRRELEHERGRMDALHAALPSPMNGGGSGRGSRTGATPVEHMPLAELMRVDGAADRHALRSSSA